MRLHPFPVSVTAPLCYRSCVYSNIQPLRYMQVCAVSGESCEWNETELCMLCPALFENQCTGQPGVCPLFALQIFNLHSQTFLVFLMCWTLRALLFFGKICVLHSLFVKSCLLLLWDWIAENIYLSKCNVSYQVMKSTRLELFKIMTWTF